MPSRLRAALPWPRNRTTETSGQGLPEAGRRRYQSDSQSHRRRPQNSSLGGRERERISFQRNEHCRPKFDRSALGGILPGFGKDVNVKCLHLLKILLSLHPEIPCVVPGEKLGSGIECVHDIAFYPAPGPILARGNPSAVSNKPDLFDIPVGVSTARRMPFAFATGCLMRAAHALPFDCDKPAASPAENVVSEFLCVFNVPRDRTDAFDGRGTESQDLSRFLEVRPSYLASSMAASCSDAMASRPVDWEGGTSSPLRLLSCSLRMACQGAFGLFLD